MASSSLAFRDRVADLLVRKAGQWVDARELMQVGGMMAWRSRVSDARRQLGMRIENRQRKVNGITVSEYRYVSEGRLF